MTATAEQSSDSGQWPAASEQVVPCCNEGRTHHDNAGSANSPNNANAHHDGGDAGGPLAGRSASRLCAADVSDVSSHVATLSSQTVTPTVATTPPQEAAGDSRQAPAADKHHLQPHQTSELASSVGHPVQAIAVAVPSPAGGTANAAASASRLTTEAGTAVAAGAVDAGRDVPVPLQEAARGADPKSVEDASAGVGVRDCSAVAVVVEADVQAGRPAAGVERFERLCRGKSLDGDSGSGFERPPWFDAQLYEAGRRLLWDNLCAVLFCHLCALVIGASSEVPYLVLLANGNHSTPRALAARYVSTTKQVLAWYCSDIFDPNSEGHKSIRRVRAMHGAANRYMERLGSRQNGGEKWISQYWMALTQSSFIRLIVMHPRQMGLPHLGDEELAAIVHYWRCIGYLLGISDEFNTCAGNVADFRELNKVIAEREINPAMQNCSEGQMKLSQSIMEAFMHMSPNRWLRFTVPVFMAFIGQACGLKSGYKLTFRERLYLWLLKAVFCGPLLGVALVRKLGRRRMLMHLNHADRVGIAALGDDLIEGLDDPRPALCPFVSRAAG